MRSTTEEGFGKVPNKQNPKRSIEVDSGFKTVTSTDIGTNNTSKQFTRIQSATNKSKEQFSKNKDQ